MSDEPPLKISRWDKFRAKHGLEIYGVFGKQVAKKDGGPKRVGLARLGIVLANVFTVGLVNIGWRIQQERRREKRLNKVTKITETHSSPLERKINMFVDLVRISFAEKPYRNFASDLRYFLFAQFGLAREEREVDEEFMPLFQKLLEDDRTATKIEEIYRMGQGL